MKKSLLVAALVAVMVLSFGSAAFAKNAGSAANTVAGGGYVSWATALSVASGTAAEASGPHANYATSTVKCAVCHSVHGAPDGSLLLTRATTTAGATNAGQVCAYCHGYGATAGAHIVAINQAPTENSPHSSICYTTCHAGVHGLNVSTRTVLSTKLLRNGADAGIAVAIADANSGVTAATFTQPTVGNATATQLSMATGYVCAQTKCHTGSAFAITKRGDHMATADRGTISGHPVIAAASTNFTVPAGTSYNSGAAGPVVWDGSKTVAALPVAFKATNGCDTCHDVGDLLTTDGTAFPHNRGASNLWMTKAANASGVGSTMVTNNDVIDSSTGTVIGLADNYTTVQDGVCLKCHVSSDGLSGVGKTF